jgi:hypothetical protein
MAAFNDEEEKTKPAAQPSAPKPTDGGMGGGTNAQRAPVSYPFQRTFQQPQTAGATPGQQSPMPWSGLMPGMAPGGNGATPWAQSLQAPQQQNAQPGGILGGPGQGQGSPVGMPNWGALMQRFGGGGQQAAAPSFLQGWGGGQQAQGGGMQGNQWLQGAIQQLAQRFAGARGGAPQGGGFQMPQWGGVPQATGGALPQGAGSTFAMPRGGMPIIPGRTY